MLPSVGENIMPRFGRREGYFFHKGLQTYILVHGDDFFIVDRFEERKRALSLLRSAYELRKVVTLGTESSQSQTASFLGRTLTLRHWGIEYEPDQQHVSRGLKALGLTNAKGVATLGTDDVSGPRASKIRELLERQNGTILRKKSKRRMTFSLEKN